VIPTDIQFPPLCALCLPDYAPADCPIGTYSAAGIGHVCKHCREHVAAAREALAATPGIKRHMIPDGTRNDQAARVLRNPPSRGVK
jgi:hypothetical protein